MASRKVYPDLGRLRRLSDMTVRAIEELNRIEVSINRIVFRFHNPLIEVDHCPGCAKIVSGFGGKGHDDYGNYILKVGVLHGCQVNWRESC